MRPSSASATALVRESMCSLMASMRPVHMFSKRPMTRPTARSVSPETLVSVRSAALVTWASVRSASLEALLSACDAVRRWW